MESLIIHPKNKKQLSVLKDLFKEMQIPFEKSKDRESLYNTEFEEKIKTSEKQISEGHFKTYSLEEFDELCK